MFARIKYLWQCLCVALSFLFSWKGGVIVLAMLYATSIIQGKRKFSQIPKTLKEQVREILIDAGMEELIDE